MRGERVEADGNTHSILTAADGRDVYWVFGKARLLWFSLWLTLSVTGTIYPASIAVVMDGGATCFSFFFSLASPYHTLVVLQSRLVTRSAGKSEIEPFDLTTGSVWDSQGSGHGNRNQYIFRIRQNRNFVNYNS